MDHLLLVLYLRLAAGNLEFQKLAVEKLAVEKLAVEKLAVDGWLAYLSWIASSSGPPVVAALAGHPRFTHS